VNTPAFTPANTRTSAALATRAITALRRPSTNPPQASLTDVPHGLTLEDPDLLATVVRMAQTFYDFLRSTTSHVALDHPGYRPAGRHQTVTVTGRNARDSENASRMLSSGRSASGASLVSPPGPAPINWSSKK
jgi:hypothetical protein